LRVCLEVAQIARVAGGGIGKRVGMTLGIVEGLLGLVEASQPGIVAHSRRTAEVALSMTIQMGWPPEDAYRAYLGGLVHDIGRALVVSKRSDASEGDVDHEHVLMGEKLVATIPALESLLPAVKYHCERADGSGGPYGVANEQTPWLARVLIVANAFEHALASVKGDVAEAVKTISSGSGSKFDEAAVSALQACARVDGFLSSDPLSLL
jgi:HD-GYP domain-containing protein (c-di-GMP phosphodiesterase class II)